MYVIGRGFCRGRLLGILIANLIYYFMAKNPAPYFRNCPCCKKRGVDIAQLYDGARCLYCSKIIEVNCFYTILFSTVSVLSVYFLFTNSYGLAGLFVTILTVVLTSGYKQITARFFPLKNYEK